MLPVKNGMIGRTIDQSRVVSVAKGAIEEVLQGKPDESQYMNPVDQVYDLFCGKVKRLTIERVSGMSHHTAKLHTELERTGDNRRPDLINSEIAQIDQNKEELSKLMQGSTLEFGYSGSRPIVDESSYLVYTDKSTFMPMGVALYPSHMAGVARGTDTTDRILPNFHTAADIEPEHLQPIRAQGKIRFVEKEKEEEKGKVKVKVKEKEYQVRTFNFDEPIVICTSSDLFAKAVQSRLSTIWIYQLTCRSQVELSRLEQLDGSLRLPSILPVLAPGAIRSAEELAFEQVWNVASANADSSLTHTAEKLQEILNGKKAQADKIFKRLENNNTPLDNQRAELLGARKIMDAYKARLAELRKDIEEIRQIYLKLGCLARKCETSELRSIFTVRIENFSAALQAYSEIRNSPDEERTFFRKKHAQGELLRNFDPAQFLLCTNLLYPRPLVLRGRTVIVNPPVAPIPRAELIRLLKNPNRTWIQIKNAMDRLELAQRQLLEARMFRNDLVAKLDHAFSRFKGTDGQGMDPKTEKSFYTPETFSRIVSLRALRAELSDGNLQFTMDALQGKDGTISGHVYFIERETVAIDQSEKSLRFFEKPARHIPERDRVTCEFLDHLQWENFQRSMKLLVDGIP